MKRLPLLLCAAVLAAMPVASQAAVQSGGLSVDLGLGLGGGLLIGGPQDDRHRHHDDGNQNDRRDDRRGDDRRGYDGRYNNAPPQPPRYAPPPAAMYDRRPGGGGGNEYRDNGINRAVAIGNGHGRVLNAWPQGGSLFLVRVDTPHGRVDMIIDVDSGRVVGER